MKNFTFKALCVFLSLFAILGIEQVTAQTALKKAKLSNFAAQKSQEFQQQKAEAIAFAEKNKIPLIIKADGRFMELQYIEDGIPIYFVTYNVNAAATISTNKVHSGGGAGLNLDGSGIVIREWDGGSILATHQEFGNRVVQGDNPTSTHYHAVHVAGTMIASGVQANAKGMAPAANLRAFDWNNDESEMAIEAANGALISNHSYGYGTGWEWNGTAWQWYGNSSISNQEDYKFGFYDANAKDYDQIAYDAPQYLIAKAAGNDRGNGPTNGAYPQDGPYDCIGTVGTAKNILTVGAVNDIPGGYTGVASVVMSSFSSWGPADDGRIKPDICANGVGVYSPDDGGNTSYRSLSGTSMATPSVTGSMALLQQHYQALKGAGNFMRSATLKALIIHTADEAGSNTGPDYQFGWGLMNTENAALKISEDQNTNVIEELTLNNDSSYTRTVELDGNQPLRITIVWTDVPGTPVAASLDPADTMLVNDLNLKITNGANTYYPWKLDRTNPSNAATNNSENNVDNVELVDIPNPVAGTYTITVDHNGTLNGNLQAFSIIISGIEANNPQVPPVAEFTTSTTTVNIGESVTFTDQSLNTPTSWAWTFNGGTPSSSTAQNPSVTYSTIGTYTVELTATNAQGSDTETKTNYITVQEPVITYCASKGNNSSYLWIGGVSVGSFNNISGAAGYTDFTGQLIPMVAGSNSVSLTPGYPGTQYNVGWNVWIDLNRDGDFADSGENMYTSSIGTSVANGTIAIPSSFSGQTRMRVSMKYNATPTSCETFSYGEVEDYTINIGTSTGQPPVAAFTASSTSINVGQSVTFTDQSTNTPTSWSWAFNGGTPSASSSQNPVITYNTAGTYNVSLTATNSYGNNTETKTAYITVTEPTVTYCASQGNNSTYEWISGVTIGAFNNTSGAANYTDFTSQTISLNAGNSYAVTLTPGFASSSYAEYWKIWIDFNRDGDFTDAGEELFSNNGSAAVSGNIAIPTSANGSTRMRISMKYNAVQTSCETFTYGEVEDYTVTFISATEFNYSINNVEDKVELVNLYPNPSNGEVFLSISDNIEGKVGIRVFGLNGQLVYEQNLYKTVNEGNSEINLNHLISGMYYVQINYAGKSFSKKLMINK